MAFSTQFLEELSLRISLAEVIGRRVRLTRKGREHAGLCPFHKEKSPSFTVNEEKGFYHCFGCQAHGSVFDFVMENEGLSFPEAIERLAHEAGVDVPRATPEERQRQQRNKTLIEVMETATAWFEQALRMPGGKTALTYLKDRGLDDATIKHFRLGVALPGRDRLSTELAHAGINIKLLLAAGLIIQPDDERPPYDRFRDRVMFPIGDRRGRIIAFGGRTLDENPDKKVPKYLNSPETALFNKGQTLYGLAQAGPASHSAGALIVTEGYMDVIALYQAGFQHAVAPLGTAVTEKQIALMWKLVREPVLCLDGDSAGRRAAAKTAERALPLLKPGYGLRFAGLPAGEDPDSLVAKHGPKAMADILTQALPLSEVLWQSESGGRLPTTPEARAGLQQRLYAHAKRIEDRTVRAHFTAEFGKRIWPLRKTGGRRSKDRSDGGNLQLSPNVGPTTHIDAKICLEQILLAVMINHPTAFDEIGERLGTVSFSEPGLDNMRQEVLKILAENSRLDSDALENQLKSCGFSGALDVLLTGEVYDNAFFARPEGTLEAALAGWEETFYRMQTRDLKIEIDEARRAFKNDPSEAAGHRLKVLMEQQMAGVGLADGFDDDRAHRT